MTADATAGPPPGAVPRAEPTPPLAPGTGGRATAALGWSFLNTVLSRVGTLGIGVVLARLLGPEEFGTYAVAFVALIAVLSFNELGVSLAIVRWPVDPRVIAPTVTTLSFAMSALLTAASFLLAPWFAAVMGRPEAAPVVQLLSLSILISGAVATPAALMQRAFQQRRRLVIDQVAVWVGAGSSITLALLGTGAMSLAVGRVAGALVGAALFIKLSPQPYRFGFDRTQIRPLLSFGLPLAGASIVVFAVGYADQLIVGNTLGALVLGYYVLAFNLSSWPVSIFSQPLRSVAPAAFARLQDRPELMRSSFRSLLGLLTAVVFPVCLVMASAAEPLIRFVYGPAWAPAAAALHWLAVLAACKIVFELAYDYLVVLGVSLRLLWLQVAGLVALVPAVLVGAELGGMAGAAAAQVLVAVVVMLPLYLLQLRRAGFHVLPLLARLLRPVGVGVVVAVAAVALDQHSDEQFFVLAMSGLVTVACILGLLVVDRNEIRLVRAAVARVQ